MTTFEYIKSKTQDEVCKTNSKKVLQKMYKDLYGIEPRHNSSKDELTYKLFEFVQSQIRTDDLCKILK